MSWFFPRWECCTHCMVSHSESLQLYFSCVFFPAEQEMCQFRGGSSYFWNLCASFVPSPWSHYGLVLSNHIRVGNLQGHQRSHIRFLTCEKSHTVLLKPKLCKKIVISPISSPWVHVVFDFFLHFNILSINQFTSRSCCSAVTEKSSSETPSREMLICFDLRGNNVTQQQAHQQQLLIHNQTAHREITLLLGCVHIFNCI